MLQYFNFSLLHRHYFISQAKSGFFLWDNVTCFASCKPFYDPGFICLGNYFINMNTNFTVKTNVVYLKFNMFRPPILPQVGSTHRPGRHEWRPKGLPQVWHQRHHQGTFPYYYTTQIYQQDATANVKITVLIGQYLNKNINFYLLVHFRRWSSMVFLNNLKWSSTPV